ncbi:MAG: M48 family metallopeptidase [Verrucomicrobiota bacterium]
MDYEGSAFHPDLPKGKTSGLLRIYGGSFYFESTHKSVQFPVNDCSIECGGANNRLIFFTAKSQSDWKIYTSDQRILQEPDLHHHQEAQYMMQSMNRRKIALPAVFLSIIGFIVLAIWAVWTSRESLVEIAANQIPPSWEVKAGDLFFEQISKQTPIVDRKDLTEKLTKLAEPLAQTVISTEKSPYLFKFHIADDAELNAFAMPGGHIVINAGLIAKASEEEEVLGVLAHEIAHVTRRHSLRQIIKGAGLYIIVQTLLGDLTGLLAVIADQGTFLLTRQFSRDYEREADEVAWHYLIEAEIDPRGLLTFFETLQKEYGENDELEKTFALLSTHPQTSERIAWLEQKSQELTTLSFEKSTTIDFKAFQKEINSLLVIEDEDGN